MKRLRENAMLEAEISVNGDVFVEGHHVGQLAGFRFTLAAVTDVVGATGAARLQTWLLEDDRVSAGFFESTGWAPDGWARTLDTGDTPLREVRWHTLLGGGEDQRT